jgi:dihydrofolate reductase
MSLVTCHMSISLDGYVAGPDQGPDDPVGVGGLRLHEWHWHAGEPGHEADLVEEPPYHAPVFVLTHYPHDPIEMAGGTTFHFVTDGFGLALAQAVAAADGADVDIAGGASAVRQAFAAGAVDELVLDVVPVLLGRGERLFDGVADPGFTPVEVVPTPYATHLRYHVGS